MHDNVSTPLSSVHTRISAPDISHIAGLKVGRKEFEGYLYILGFSTGMVKVGKSNTPHSRIRNHHDEAARFGATIDHLWVSASHRNYNENEDNLLSLLGVAAIGNEYFNSTPFDSVVETAERELDFIILTEEMRKTLQDEKEAAEIEAYQKLQNILPPKDLPMIRLRAGVRPDLPNLFFGHGVTADTFHKLKGPLGEYTGEDVSDLVSRYADVLGVSESTVRSWSHLEWYEAMLHIEVKVSSLYLQTLAAEAGRVDLVEPNWVR